MKTFQDGMKVWGTSRNAKIQGKWWSPLQHEFCVLFNFFAQTWHLGMYWKKTISYFSKRRSYFTSNMGIQQCHNVITIKIVTLLKSIIKDLLCQKLVYFNLQFSTLFKCCQYPTYDTKVYARLTLISIKECQFILQKDTIWTKHSEKGWQ